LYDMLYVVGTFTGTKDMLAMQGRLLSGTDDDTRSGSGLCFWGWRGRMVIRHVVGGGRLGDDEVERRTEYVLGGEEVMNSLDSAGGGDSGAARWGCGTS